MKSQQVKKKLAGGRKYFFLIIFTIIILVSNKLFPSQIFDYQTDKFIEKINKQILSVNNYDKKLHNIIINDKFPNAFVTEDLIIYISSGLISYSPDYVSFLGVLAHEIGHLENYHIAKRKKQITNLQNINSYGNLAALLGSMIMQDPNLINAIIVNQTSINNLYLNFSQEQEIQADLYAINTINKLQLPTNSIKEFLLILEDKTKFDLIDKELRKFSTHPLFEKRYEIIDNNEIKLMDNYDELYEKEFNFIKAKFMAYTDNGFIEQLEGDYKIYYDSIQYSKLGNLKESLKKINLLIQKYSNNIFLLETKGDILLSYGYDKEAIKFYNKVLNKQPDNNYVKYNIFTKLNFKKNNYKLNQKLFLENLKLIYLFPNNQVLITKFYNLSKSLKYKEWIVFFEILIFKNKNFRKNLIELKKETKDNNLKKMINLYT